MLKILLLIGLGLLIYWLAKRTFAPGAGLTINDAAKLLDVAPDADAETINAAHKRLIAKVHPDAGGSPELASRINQARDTMLRKLPK